MKHSTTPNTLLILVCAVGNLLGVWSLANEAVAPLSLTENEPSQPSTAYLEVIDQNRILMASLADSLRDSAELRKSLENANAECSHSRRQAFELRKRAEVLGLLESRTDGAGLDKTFLNTVSDLQVLVSENRRLKLALLRLSEAAQGFCITADGSNPNARLALEAETRKAAEAIGLVNPMRPEGTVLHPSLTDGLVVSVMESLSIVVANIGIAQGIKVGTPLRVTRGEKVLAGVRVVDARENISGAMIQHLGLKHERIRIGDRVSIDATQSQFTH